MPASSGSLPSGLRIQPYAAFRGETPWSMTARKTGRAIASAESDRFTSRQEPETGPQPTSRSVAAGK